MRKYLISFCVVFALVSVSLFAYYELLDVEKTPRQELSWVARQWGYRFYGHEVEVPYFVLPKAVRAEISEILDKQYQGRWQATRTSISFDETGTMVRGVRIELFGTYDGWGFPFPRMNEEETKAFVANAIEQIKKTNKR